MHQKQTRARGQKSTSGQTFPVKIDGHQIAMTRDHHRQLAGHSHRCGRRQGDVLRRQQSLRAPPSAGRRRCRGHGPRGADPGARHQHPVADGARLGRRPVARRYGAGPSHEQRSAPPASHEAPTTPRFVPRTRGLFFYFFLTLFCWRGYDQVYNLYQHNP